MLVIWIGAACVLIGLLISAGQAIGRGPLSVARRSRSAGPTLEPNTPTGGGFGFKANWPGLALIAVGAVLLLVGAAF